MSVYSPERASILRMALVYRHPFGYYGSPYSDRALPVSGVVKGLVSTIDIVAF